MNALLEGRDRHHRIAAARPLQGHGGRHNIKLVNLNKWGNQYVFRFNQLFKPFDNAKIRQARSTPSTRRTFSTA